MQKITSQLSSEETLDMLRQAQAAINGGPALVRVDAKSATGDIEAYEVVWSKTACVRIFRCAAGTTVEPHAHASHEITCILSGSLEAHIDDGRDITLRAGEHMVIDANTKHHGQYLEDTCGAVILFHGDQP